MQGDARRLFTEFILSADPTCHGLFAKVAGVLTAHHHEHPRRACLHHTLGDHALEDVSRDHDTGRGRATNARYGVATTCLAIAGAGALGQGGRWASCYERRGRALGIGDDVLRRERRDGARSPTTSRTSTRSSMWHGERPPGPASRSRRSHRPARCYEIYISKAGTRCSTR